MFLLSILNITYTAKNCHPKRAHGAPSNIFRVMLHFNYCMAPPYLLAPAAHLNSGQFLPSHSIVMPNAVCGRTVSPTDLSCHYISRSLTPCSRRPSRNYESATSHSTWSCFLLLTEILVFILKPCLLKVTVISRLSLKTINSITDTIEKKLSNWSDDLSIQWAVASSYQLNGKTMPTEDIKSACKSRKMWDISKVGVCFTILKILTDFTEKELMNFNVCIGVSR